MNIPMNIKILLPLFLMAVTPLYGDDFRVTWDYKGMPRCLSFDGTNDGLLFRWSEEKTAFERSIEVSRHPGSCSDLPIVLKLMSLRRPWMPYSPRKQDSFGSFRIPPEVRFPLSQVEAGGTQFRWEKTGKDFLLAHPIQSYDHALNLELTTKYGAEFSAQIYASYVQADPKNAEFKNAVDAQILVNEARPLSQSPLKGITFLIVPGLMQTPSTDRAKPVRDFLQQRGMSVEIVASNTVASVSENALTLKNEIEGRLKKGEKLFFISASKGTTELFKALSDVQLLGPGRIVGLASMAGVIEGSFIAGWTVEWPQSFIAYRILKNEAEKVGLTMQDLRGLESITPKALAGAADRYQRRLPKTFPFFSIIGVPTNNFGLVRNVELRQLQDNVYRQILKTQGANDGYVEFPGTSVPREWGLNSVELVVNGSHVILDGRYKTSNRELNLENQNDRDIFLNAVFWVISQRIA